MKRDMDLVVKLLTAIEQSNAPEIDRSSIKVDGYDPDVIEGHINLVVDTGFVIGGDRPKFDIDPNKHLSRRAKYAEQLFGTGGLRLSWAGHDYLDTQRQNSAS